MPSFPERESPLLLGPGNFHQGQKRVHSGAKNEHKPKLLSPDIFRWGWGLPRQGVGAKKFGIPLETREIKLYRRDIPGFCRDIPGFCRDIPEVPEKFEKKSLCSIFVPIHHHRGTPPFSVCRPTPRSQRQKNYGVYRFPGKTREKGVYHRSGKQGIHRRGLRPRKGKKEGLHGGDVFFFLPDSREEHLDCYQKTAVSKVPGNSLGNFLNCSPRGGTHGAEGSRGFGAP